MWLFATAEQPAPLVPGDAAVKLVTYIYPWLHFPRRETSWGSFHKSVSTTSGLYGTKTKPRAWAPRCGWYSLRLALKRRLYFSLHNNLMNSSSLSPFYRQRKENRVGGLRLLPRIVASQGYNEIQIQISLMLQPTIDTNGMQPDNVKSLPFW